MDSDDGVPSERMSSDGNDDAQAQNQYDEYEEDFEGGEYEEEDPSQSMVSGVGNTAQANIQNPF